MKKGIVAVLTHSLKRIVLLWLVLVVGIYGTIWVINMGGALDDMRRTQIRFEVAAQVRMNPEIMELPPSVVQELVDEAVERAIRVARLDEPFIVRSGDYLWRAMTLNLGRSESMISDRGSRQVRNILLERLPTTLLLFGTTDLFLFFFALFFALALSRRYGSWLDRLIITLAPTSAAPGWFYGIFLILIFAAILGVLPWGGMVGSPPPADRWSYALDVMRHMILPVSAMVIGAIFASIYSWRTFFLIYSSEDYVDLAKAKGLSSRAIERRYILRPTLPPILTNFLLMLIVIWTGAIILETVFNWPGLGRLLYQAIGSNDTPVIVGSTVIYGYLLMITIFFLDIIYSIVDPRVRVGAGTRR